jgi:diketogulonate reductase-like aldo/keto reductase
MRRAPGSRLQFGILFAQLGNAMADSAIPQRRFGRHDDLVSIIGLGGYHLGTIPTRKEAIAVVRAAIDAGVTFMDNPWDPATRVVNNTAIPRANIQRSEAL